jgi:molybdopterin-guanine dinucleotide biosynthesis protein
MNNCVIIGCQSIGKTALMLAIVERLREKGLDVIVVGADDVQPPKQIGIVFDESRAIERLLAAVTAKVHDIDCKIDFEWKRERDYPTLKEGIRRNQIRRLKK